MNSIEPLAQSILDFWFGELDAHGKPKDTSRSGRWFKKDPKFDEEIGRKFADQLDAASWGGFDLWSLQPEGMTALIVLMDQFPRNLYRNQARSFYLDQRAQRFAEITLENEWHLQFQY